MKSLVQHILSLVSHPILSFLYRWIYDGELEDTYHEVRAASTAFSSNVTHLNRLISSEQDCACISFEGHSHLALCLVTWLVVSCSLRITAGSSTR